MASWIVELPITPLPSMRGLDPATLFRICSWADDGELERAGTKAENLLRDGTYDYQLVVVWLAHRFTQDGVAELERIVEAALGQLTTDLEAAAPADATLAAQELDRAFSWLMLSLTQRVHFHCTARDGVWSRWVSALESDSMTKIASSVERAVARLDEALIGLPDPRSSGELRKLERRLRGGFGAIVEELERGREEARRAGPRASEVELPETGEHPAESTVVAPVAVSEGASFGSERLRLLRRKLDGFRRFVDTGALREAAIVARDVERELAQFDPLQYLPEIFSDYLLVLCDKGDQLEEYMGEGESLEQRALERLYMADPLRFMGRRREGGLE